MIWIILGISWEPYQKKDLLVKIQEVASCMEKRFGGY